MKYNGRPVERIEVFTPKGREISRQICAVNRAFTGLMGALAQGGNKWGSGDYGAIISDDDNALAQGIFE
jgi:hypothetical protein